MILIWIGLLAHYDTQMQDARRNTQLNRKTENKTKQKALFYFFFLFFVPIMTEPVVWFTFQHFFALSRKRKYSAIHWLTHKVGKFNLSLSLQMMTLSFYRVPSSHWLTIIQSFTFLLFLFAVVWCHFFLNNIMFDFVFDVVLKTTSNFKLQTSNFKLQLQTSNFKLDPMKFLLIS